MPRESKKGACSSHTLAAKANCLAHNRREGNVPSYVNSHLTADNRTIFEDAVIRGRKSIVPFVKAAERDYTEKTGQKCQKSFTPFRESCLVVKAGVTDAQLLDFKEQAEKLTGWKCIGIWLHQDEGHAHSKYIEGDEDFAINYHAHVLWDCINHDSGKAIRCDRTKLSKMQDILADAVGMERGNKAKDTGRRRRSASEQRIHSLEQRIVQLEQEAAAREERLRAANSKAKEMGAAAIEGLHSLLQPGKAKQQREEEIATARDDERAKVIEEVQKAAGIALPDATAKSIGENWGNRYVYGVQKTREAKRLNEDNQVLAQRVSEFRKDIGKLTGENTDLKIRNVKLEAANEQQGEQLRRWISADFNLLARAIAAIRRFALGMISRLTGADKADIGRAAEEIGPHSLYLASTAKLPTEAHERAENAIISAIHGDGEKVETTAQNAESRSKIRLNVEGIDIEMTQIAKDIISDEVSKFSEQSETSLRITNAAILLAYGYINAATTYAESHGGGGGGGMTSWGRKREEDDEAWLRRCANTARSLFMTPKQKYKFKR